MYIISIKVEKRQKEVPEIQEILTKYGEGIEARFGLHTLEKKGLIIVVYNNEKIEQFVEEINNIKNITVNYMKV